MIEPNGLERRAAYDLERTADRNGIAYALAEAREGATLEGPRVVVSGHSSLPRRAIERANDGRDGALLEQATRRAWRSWFDELHRQGLRPCGWPAVQRTHLAFAYSSLDSTHPFVEVDPEVRNDWDELVVSVTCEAVPAT